MEETKEIEQNNSNPKDNKKMLGIGIGVASALAILIVALLLIFLLPREQRFNISLDSFIENVTLSGNGNYTEWQTVTIKAEDIEGYRFINWTFNDEIISDEQEYEFTISEETQGQYIANYAEIFNITSTQSTNGSFIIDKNEAIEGEQVTLNIIPEEFYFIDSVYYTIGDELTQYEVIETDDKYSFEMPIGDVSINVTFREAMNYSEDYDIAPSGILSSYKGSEENLVIPESFSIKEGEIVYGFTVESMEQLFNYTIYLQGGPFIVTYNGSQDEVQYSNFQSFVLYLITMQESDINTLFPATFKITNPVVKNFIVRIEDEIKNLPDETKAAIIETQFYLSLATQTNFSVTLNNNKVQYDNFDAFSEDLEPLLDDNSILNLLPIEVELSNTIVAPTLTNTIVTCEGDDYQITTIDSNAFNFNSTIKSITLPSTINTINENAFSACLNLETIDLSNCTNLETISDRAFNYCSNLKTVILPANLASFGQNVFSRCPSIEEILVSDDSQYWTSENGILYNKDKTQLVFYPAGKAETSFTVPSSITSIGSFAFAYNTTLESVDMSACSNLTLIDYDAFYSCSKLNEVILPTSLEEIGRMAFSSCINLQTLDLSYCDNLTTIGEYAFNASAITSLVIPESVNYIGVCAFMACANMESVTFEDVTGWNDNNYDNQLTAIDDINQYMQTQIEQKTGGYSIFSDSYNYPTYIYFVKIV